MEIHELINNVNIYGLENSFRVSKFPMQTDVGKCTEDFTPRILALGTCNKGEGHDNFLKGIVVQFDLTFTVKAWTEAERYHRFDIVSSQSTMHKITKFDPDTSYIHYVDPRIVAIMKEKIKEYNDLDAEVEKWKELGDLVDMVRGTELLKEKYLEILYTNPCGFKLTAGMSTNYQQLKTIYSQRKNHRLPEWRTFCEWIESLPYSELITGQ